MLAWLNLADMYAKGWGVKKSTSMAGYILDTMGKHILEEMKERGYENSRLPTVEELEDENFVASGAQ